MPLEITRFVFDLSNTKRDNLAITPSTRIAGRGEPARWSTGAETREGFKGLPRSSCPWSHEGVALHREGWANRVGAGSHRAKPAHQPKRQSAQRALWFPDVIEPHENHRQQALMEKTIIKPLLGAAFLIHFAAQADIATCYSVRDQQHHGNSNQAQ